MTQAVLLFDGLCNFCNSAIMFVVDHERSPDLKFAPLQSEIARELLVGAMGAERAKTLIEGTTGNGDPDTMVLVEGTRASTHSTGALRIASHLRAPWRWLVAFVLVPRPLRDWVYRYIAKNRYRWFGKADACRVPTPELRARFLA